MWLGEGQNAASDASVVAAAVANLARESLLTWLGCSVHVCLVLSCLALMPSWEPRAGEDQDKAFRATRMSKAQTFRGLGLG